MKFIVNVDIYFVAGSYEEAEIVAEALKHLLTSQPEVLGVHKDTVEDDE